MVWPMTRIAKYLYHFTGYHSSGDRDEPYCNYRSRTCESNALLQIDVKVESVISRQTVLALLDSAKYRIPCRNVLQQT